MLHQNFKICKGMLHYLVSTFWILIENYKKQIYFLNNQMIIKRFNNLHVRKKFNTFLCYIFTKTNLRTYYYGFSHITIIQKWFLLNIVLCLCLRLCLYIIFFSLSIYYIYNFLIRHTKKTDFDAISFGKYTGWDNARHIFTLL